MDSIWVGGEEHGTFPMLQGDITTDVLVIGGGIAGVLCTYFLKLAGVDCVLVEGKQIGQGITKNTTAKITSQHGLLYAKLLRQLGAEKTGLYLAANQRALEAFRGLARQISCDFEQKNAYVFSFADRAVIEREVAAVNRLGFPATFHETTALPFPVAGAIRFPEQAQFHPLKFLNGIAKNLPIYENTYVKDLVKTTAITDNGTIRAKKIVVATHFPFINKHGSYFIKIYQHRSYAIALENVPDIDGMYLEETKDGLSFRNYQNRLIVGGGDHRTGKEGGNWKAIRAFAQTVFPQAAERYHWATQDCMTLDSIPYIGPYSAGTENLYVATGFNKWGMTSAMAAAMILTDLITGKQNDSATVFSPSRCMLKPQLFVNGASAVLHLLTPTKKRCPHLGCALQWNPIEHTWDCPCHGSRFTAEGALIDNPATGGLRK